MSETSAGTPPSLSQLAREVHAVLQGRPGDELYVAAKELLATYDLVKEVAEAGKLPVVVFTVGGTATPADAAMMQLGAEGVFIGSGTFKSGDPAQRAEALVKATTFFDDPDVIAKVPAVSARPWSASTSTRWPSHAVSPSAEGDGVTQSQPIVVRMVNAHNDPGERVVALAPVED